MSGGAGAKIARWTAIALPVCFVLALRDVAGRAIGSTLDPAFRLTSHYEQAAFLTSFYAMWAALTPFILALARRFPLGRRTALLHLAVGVAVCLVAPTALSMLVGGLLLGRGWPTLGGLLSPFWTRRALYGALGEMYWIILGVGFAVHAYEKAQAGRREAADLERGLVAAQVDALRMKLQPHFLFNTLNSINFLAVEGDGAGVVTMVGRLAGLLRSSMQPAQSQLTTVTEEMKLLDQYLAIEEVRFGDRLHVTRHVAPAAATDALPSLLLQPIVENSIKHGFSRRIDASRLDIDVRREGGTLVVKVEDDGPGLPPGWEMTTGCGRGLKNVIERLDKLYPGAWTVTLTNRPAGGVVTELRIPADVRA